VLKEMKNIDKFHLS